MEGLLWRMEEGKEGNHPDLPAAGANIAGSVLNPVCCVTTGHTLEQGDRQGWFSSASPANLLHCPHPCWDVLSCYFSERSGKCWSSNVVLLLLIVEWVLPRGQSYADSLAPEEFHALGVECRVLCWVCKDTPQVAPVCAGQRHWACLQRNQDYFLPIRTEPEFWTYLG